MENGKVSVLVVDDSALMRNLVSRIIEAAPDLSLAATAMNGVFALQKLERLEVDCIVLDLEMPEMNGIQFLEERRKRGIDIPVVVLSSIAQKGAQITMEALSMGAADFVAKPSGSVSHDIHAVAETLTEMVRSYGSAYRKRKRASANHATSQPVPERQKSTSAPSETPKVSSTVAPPAPGSVELVAIGVSTGGPNALRKLFAALPGTLNVPIVVVQHMPAGFTAEFARSLDRISPYEVKEAEDGDVFKPNRVLIAPGNRHITVEKRSLAGLCRLNDEPPRNGHRPSADVLFRSVAAEYGNSAIAVIMTGMGRDGAVELGAVYRAGGVTIAQDEASCIVYGMPRAAVEAGVVTEIVALHDLAGRITEYVERSTVA